MNLKKNMFKIGRFTLVVGIFVLCGVVCTCTSLSKAGIEVFGGLGKPSDPVPTTEKLRSGTLPSGLRYFILENTLPEKRAYLTLAVKAGSVLEEEDERGLAHFVEHMAFNGTVRFPEAELVNYLRSLGMRFGPEINAYTSFDETVYGIEVPVEIDDNGVRRIPDTALAVLDDWTRAITFAPSDVDDERAVIMEEYRSRLGAMDRVMRQMMPVLFRGSPYAERIPIGLPEIIQSAPASRLEGFYKKWYQADNMALILVGDFDGAALEASLTEHFLISKPAVPTQRPQYDLLPPRRGIVEILILTDPELTSTQVNLYFKRNREAVRSDLSYYREELIDTLIDRMLSFRFQDETMRPATPYIWAGAGNIRYGTSSRFYVMLAESKTGSAEESLVELLRAKESMLRYGFTEAELRIAGNSLISDLRTMALEKDRQESSNYIDYLSKYFLEGRGSFTDAEWELEAAQKLLAHISTKDIDAVIKDYFSAGALQIFIFAPEGEKTDLPAEPRIRQIVKESARMKIAPRKADAVKDEFLFETPVKGSVDSETVDNETGAAIWDLNNGARVILKSTKNRNDEIRLYAMARGGTTSAAPEDGVSAGLASEMLQVSGLGPYSRPELTRKLADKQVSFGYGVSDYYRTFQGSATTEDLKTLFEMLYLSFTDPRIDDDAVNAMLDQLRSSLARRDEDPDNVFFDEVNRIVYGSHPHFKALELAGLPAANIDSALSFIRKGLNPADYTFVFIGNLETEIMKEYIETYIASIPPKESWNSWTNLNIQRPGKTEKIVYKGKEEQSVVYMGWFAKVPYTEELRAAALVLNEYLNIRMNDEIREKLGGVYSISVDVSVSPVPEGELSMTAYFRCDPRRARELSSAVAVLLNQTASAPIDSGIFAKSVEALKKEWESSMQSNSYIAQSYANSSALLNLPLSRLEKRPQYYNAVAAADIQRLCAQILRNGPALVILYPEER
ncbi:MAG: insulinase family protein [Treponema sp.]|jgi:zinc protease|nr:insulinase family protein [Treponema sp.]